MSDKTILRDHIGFTLVLVFLFLAPKIPIQMIPIQISGGSVRSSISLGFLGYVIWFLICPSYLLKFSKRTIPLPIIFFNIFAFYAFFISLLSTNLVSIAYAFQFLFYVVIGSLFLSRYILKSRINNSIDISLKIFFTVMIIYAIGVLVSVFTGPFYPFQTIYTLRPWGNLWIQQGVGFSEGQNMAAEILIIFTAASIYLYQGNRFKKIILICLSLSALISTLCRSPIIAFLVAILSLLFLEFVRVIVFSGKIKKKILSSVFSLILGLFFIIIIGGISLYIINKPLLTAILLGFGFGETDYFITDLNTRFSLWSRGLNKWNSTGSIIPCIFGNGFRSSMGIVSKTGAWATSHNIFVTILAELGIIGFTIFISIFLISLLEYSHIIVKNKDINLGLLARFGFVSVLGIMIHNLAGEFLYSPISISMLILTIILSSHKLYISSYLIKNKVIAQNIPPWYNKSDTGA